MVITQTLQTLNTTIQTYSRSTNTGYVVPNDIDHNRFLFIIGALFLLSFVAGWIKHRQTKKWYDN